MWRFLSDLDVVVLAVPLVQLEDVLTSLPIDGLKGKLVVETCAWNNDSQAVLLKYLGGYPEIDILSSHPMPSSTSSSQGTDGPNSGSSWDGRHMAYEKVRIADQARCECFLQTLEEARCQFKPGKDDSS